MKVSRRRHRRTLRQHPRHLPVCKQGHKGPDRPRTHDPRGLPRLPRRAEAVRSDGARDARHRRPRGSTRRKTCCRHRPTRSAPSPKARRRIALALEMARDEQLRDLQNEERRYQIVKDLSDNLTISYSTSEVVMARLLQTTNAKERVYQQSISFFSTNETVLTALSRLVHRALRPARIDRDAERDEGGHEQEPRDPRRDRRPGRRGRGQGRLRPDHPRRCGQEAGRQRHRLPGALARHHQRDAHRRDPELGGNPRRGGRRQAPARNSGSGRQRAAARGRERADGRA